MRAAASGFWKEVGEKMGATWRFSGACAAISTSLGAICIALNWSTMCAAFKQNFWTAMCVSYGICSVFQISVLTFLDLDICPEGGCALQSDAVWTIVSGILWAVASILAYFARGPAKPGQPIACCCCATSLAGTSPQHDYIELAQNNGSEELIIFTGGSARTVRISTASSQIVIVPSGSQGVHISECKPLTNVETENIEADATEQS
jgi:hypothetical protein